MVRLFLVSLSLSLFLIASEACSPKVHFEWKYMNYTWPSEEAYNRAVENKEYIVENNFFSGVRRWKDRLYLTSPRILKGVPSVLNSIPIGHEGSPLVEPFPNWEMQKVDDCRAFQFVLGLEIDPVGRLWVIDNGRTEFQSGEPRVKCPAKLVIMDLERGGEIVLSYVFPKDVVRRNSSFLNDIVLDHQYGGMAYITDSDEIDPGLIVFSLARMTSWKIRDATMKADPKATHLTVSGTKLTSNSPINGIALSPAATKDRLIYYTPLASFNMYTIPTAAVVRQHVRNGDYSGYIRLLGRKSSQNDGMGMSANGVLYYGLLTKDAVGMWDTRRTPFDRNQRVLAQNHNTIQWADSYGFDGRLWFSSIKSQRVNTNTLDISVTNFRLLTCDVGSLGYQYFKDGSYPPIPAIKKHHYNL